MTLIQGKDVLNAAITVGIPAGTAVLVNHPVGAAGGAIYGACWAVSGFCSRWAVNKIIAQDAPIVSDICAFAAGLFGAWKAAEFFGVAMTFKSSVTLAAACVGVSLVTSLFIAVTGMCCAGAMAAGSRNRF